MTLTIPDARRSLYADKRQPERRMVIAHPELRETGGDTFTIAGYAAITHTPYAVRDFLGEYTETFTRGAFRKAIQEADDVRLLVNHEGVPLARTNSRTLVLREITDPTQDPQGRGQTGLWCEASIDAASPLAQTVRSAMARGDLDQMSFAFTATRQAWNPDYTERIVHECRLLDVSIVTYPMNPATSVELQSSDVAAMAARMTQGKATRADQRAAADMLGILVTLRDAAEHAPVSPVTQGHANALEHAKRRASVGN